MLVSYISLEPNSLSSLGIASPSFSGAATTFLATSTFIYMLLIALAVGGAFVQFVRIGGRMMMLEPSESNISATKKMTKNATLGLLGILCMFLFLFTINKDLVTGNVGLAGLRVKGGSTTPATQEPKVEAISNTGNYAARLASHKAAVAMLSPSGIHTNYQDAACTEAQLNQKSGIPSCSSLAFMKQETIQMLLKLHDACKCTIIITGGTEPGHITHGEGKRAVDLRLGGPRGDVNNNDQLYAFLRSAATNKYGPDRNCFEKFVWGGFKFCDEKPPNSQHFHVD